MEQAVIVVAVFAFIAVAVWSDRRRKERDISERHETYRKMLDQSGTSAERLLEMIERERNDRRRDKIAEGGLAGANRDRCGRGHHGIPLLHRAG